MILCLNLVKQITVPLSSTASFSEDVSQPTSTEVVPPAPKDQSKGSGDEKKKREKTEKKGNSDFVW